MLLTRFNQNKAMDNFYRIIDNYPIMEENRAISGFVPKVNTREGEFAYHIEVDLPGVNKEDVDIKIEDNALIVSGSREIKNEVKEEDYYKVESSFGRFSRSFSLPSEIDIENIHAESQNGVLEVIIPKLKTVEVNKVKKIEIK